MKNKRNSSKKLNLKTLTVADLSHVSGAGTVEQRQKEQECKTGDEKTCKADVGGGGWGGDYFQIMNYDAGLEDDSF